MIDVIADSRDRHGLVSMATFHSRRVRLGQRQSLADCDFPDMYDILKTL